MVTRVLSPHSTTMVSGFAFYYFNNPNLITRIDEILSSEHIKYYVPENGFEYTTLINQGESYQQINLVWYTYGNQGEENWYLPSSDDAPRWNTIIPYSGNINDDTYSPLSMIFWDIPIYTANPGFERMRVAYSSRSTIIASDADVDIVMDYISHTRQVAMYDNSPEIPSGGQAYIDLTHPQLSNRIYKQEQYENGALWGQTGYRQVEPINGQIDKRKTTFPSLYSSDGFTTSFIPEGEGVLITSPYLGVGYYNPSTGEFKGQRDTTFSKPPAIEGEYRVYTYHDYIILFYYFNTYEAYVSCRLGDGSWQTPWKVAEEGEVNDRRFTFFVPTYFDILPILIYNVRDSSQNVWRFCHVMNLTSDMSEGEPITSPGFSGSNQWSTYFRPERYVSASDFLSSSQNWTQAYISGYLWDDLLGLPNSEKQNIVEYWRAQFYISYHTLLQSIRHFPDRKFEISDCGIICRLEGKETAFIPYSPLIENSSTENGTISSQVSVRLVPEDSIIDNLLCYTGGKIVSLTDSEDTYEVTSGSFQMRHGVIGS